MYATCILPVTSEIYPITGAIIPPPIIDMTKNEEAIFVSSPNPFIPNAKMVGNMIDIKKGTASKAYTAMWPVAVSAAVSNKILTTA